MAWIGQVNNQLPQLLDDVNVMTLIQKYIRLFIKIFSGGVKGARGVFLALFVLIMTTLNIYWMFIQLGGELSPINRIELFTFMKPIDSANGYGGLKFGMTVADVEKRFKPDEKGENKLTGEKYLIYKTSPLNVLKDYKLDLVKCYFFEGILCRTKLEFSENYDKILQIFTQRYGFPTQSFIRSREDDRGFGHHEDRTWNGKNVEAYIIGPNNKIRKHLQSGSIEIYQDDLDRRAKKQADRVKNMSKEKKEFLRHMKADFKVNAFKGIEIGAKFDSLKMFRPRITYEDSITSVKIVNFMSRGLHTVGRFEVDSINGYFYKDELWHLKISFSKNTNEWINTFHATFTSASYQPAASGRLDIELVRITKIIFRVVYKSLFDFFLGEPKAPTDITERFYYLRIRSNILAIVGHGPYSQVRDEYPWEYIEFKNLKLADEVNDLRTLRTFISSK